MQFRTLLILSAFNICITGTQMAANYSAPSVQSSIEDTPSPAWIKYQQERFLNLDKISSPLPNVLKSSDASKPPSLVKQDFVKWQATSRNGAFQNHENKIQPVEYGKSKFKDSGEIFTEKPTSAVEFPSIKGFIEFIKSIKQTWMKHSFFRIEDKIKMLHQLKDSLLKTIENQFKVLWQDDEEDEEEDQENTTERKLEFKSSKRYDGSHLRRKRGILDESNINFPPDAALISINFLTFAVFLIKLVLVRWFSLSLVMKKKSLSR